MPLPFRVSKLLPIRPALAMGLVTLLLGSSCTVTDTAPGGPDRPQPTSAALRNKYGGYASRASRNRPVVETTRENFFAWLFAADGNPPAPVKRAKPASPAIPATKVNGSVLAQSNRANTRIVIDISRQKAFLLVGGSVAVETPVSTARPGKHTPRGSFRISERVRSGKISTIYGVGMPYWMRLSGSVYGVHAGYLPGYPASAGCVRLPSEAAQLIFDHTKHGTPVSIYSTWNGA